jgi:hypothetical protein
MPELPVKEVRLSELRLPEIKRDEIVRSLSELRLPAVEIPKVERPAVERPRLELPEALRRFDWRSIDLTGALAGAATIARLGRPVVRRRWALAAGAVIVAGVAAAALLANPGVRERAGRTVRDLRARLDTGTDADATLEIEDDVAETERAVTGIVATAEDVADVDAIIAEVEEAGRPA